MMAQSNVIGQSTGLGLGLGKAAGFGVGDGTGPLLLLDRLAIAHRQEACV